MRRVVSRFVASVVGGLLIEAGAAVAAEDLEVGVQAFQACSACHSLEPGRHMTGPSLAGIWGRKAASVEGFVRYSPALKSAGVVWNEDTLDAWMADPKSVVPGNRMTFSGLKNRQARAGLIALLRLESAPDDGTRPAQKALRELVASPGLPDLKMVGPSRLVRTIRYCRDTYEVTTADGKTLPYWETNLRLKTDSSASGPAKGRPAIMPAGMGGDRASVIFADPAEITAFIEKKC